MSLNQAVAPVLQSPTAVQNINKNKIPNSESNKQHVLLSTNNNRLSNGQTAINNALKNSFANK